MIRLKLRRGAREGSGGGDRNRSEEKLAAVGVREKERQAALTAVTERAVAVKGKRPRRETVGKRIEREREREAAEMEMEKEGRKSTAAGERRDERGEEMWS